MGDARDAPPLCDARWFRCLPLRHQLARKRAGGTLSVDMALSASIARRAPSASESSRQRLENRVEQPVIAIAQSVHVAPERCTASPMNHGQRPEACRAVPGESQPSASHLIAKMRRHASGGYLLLSHEDTYLPTFLESLATQQREPDRLLLVDDGSTDASLRLATEFAAAHSYARVVSRLLRRPPQRDRLATAAVLTAFYWAVEQLDIPWDIVAKLDGDLCLTPLTFAEIVKQFEADPRLGVAGPYTGAPRADGQLVRERCPPRHVQGATKFYRRECFGEISPIPMRVGWDTSDEVAARMRGWRTESFSMPDGDPIHLRRMASRDGQLRGYRRMGVAAWAYGARSGWCCLAPQGA